MAAAAISAVSVKNELVWLVYGIALVAAFEKAKPSLWVEAIEMPQGMKSDLPKLGLLRHLVWTGTCLLVPEVLRLLQLFVFPERW